MQRQKKTLRCGVTSKFECKLLNLVQKRNLPGPAGSIIYTYPQDMSVVDFISFGNKAMKSYQSHAKTRKKNK